LTPLEKFATSVLEAKDSRQAILSQILSKGYHPAIVFLSLNIPGSEKAPPGSEALFCWILGELSEAFPGLVILEKACDALGPYAIIDLDTDPEEAKKRCMALETNHPSARLIDLDVYSREGYQIDRKSLGFPSRPCLVCTQPAVECIRVKRHTVNEVIGKTHELLAHFRT
jgi:holo-ACP synthase CitX